MFFFMLEKIVLCQIGDGYKQRKAQRSNGKQINRKGQKNHTH
jgi:phage-related protein